jgi:hypothetical protein
MTRLSASGGGATLPSFDMLYAFATIFGRSYECIPPDLAACIRVWSGIYSDAAAAIEHIALVLPSQAPRDKRGAGREDKNSARIIRRIRI